jgi:hypothetical protein
MTLHEMTGFFGSTMIVAALETKPRGGTRMNLRFSRMVLSPESLPDRVNPSLTAAPSTGSGRSRARPEAFGETQP